MCVRKFCCCCCYSFFSNGSSLANIITNEKSVQSSYYSGFCLPHSFFFWIFLKCSISKILHYWFASSLESFCVHIFIELREMISKKKNSFTFIVIKPPPPNRQSLKLYIHFISLWIRNEYSKLKSNRIKLTIKNAHC